MRTLYTLLLACFAQATLTAQIDNGDFETWNTGPNGTTPVGWTTSDFGMGLTTDAANGNSAIQVWNWYFYGKGWVSNNASEALPLRGFQAKGGAPISIRPLTLTGQYKYTPGLNQGAIDSAVVLVSLSRFNTQTNQREPVGYAEVLLPFSDDFQAFSLPVQYSSTAQPDSFVVAILSSVKGFCGSDSEGECLYLTVDNLAFETTSGTQSVDLTPWRVFPNPANDRVWVELPTDLRDATVQVAVESATGVLLREQSTRATWRVGVETSDLPVGTYFLRLRSADGRNYGAQRVVVVR